jgi:hypothetical protein
MEIMKIIQQSGLHIWFSAENEWCFISSKGQRIRITPKINFSEAVEVVQIMKSARMIKFNEETQKIKRESVKTRGGYFDNDRYKKSIL